MSVHVILGSANQGSGASEIAQMWCLLNESVKTIILTTWQREGARCDKMACGRYHVNSAVEP